MAFTQAWMRKSTRGGDRVCTVLWGVGAGRDRLGTGPWGPCVGGQEAGLHPGTEDPCRFSRRGAAGLCLRRTMLDGGGEAGTGDPVWCTAQGWGVGTTRTRGEQMGS